MAYHDELMSQAFELLGKDPSQQTQADLRRSVSSAYYAVFHLLISEAISHWDLPGSRNTMARMFEHRMMKTVSRRFADPYLYPFDKEDSKTVGALRDLATAFVQLQDNRHIADYDISTSWTKAQAFNRVESAGKAFSLWQSIRHEQIAQDYLVALLIKPRD